MPTPKQQKEIIEDLRQKTIAHNKEERDLARGIVGPFPSPLPESR